MDGDASFTVAPRDLIIQVEGRPDLALPFPCVFLPSAAQYVESGDAPSDLASKAPSGVLVGNSTLISRMERRALMSVFLCVGLAGRTPSWPRPKCTEGTQSSVSFYSWRDSHMEAVMGSEGG